MGDLEQILNPRRPGGSLDQATGITRALARRILDRKGIEIGKKDPINVFTDTFGEAISDVNNLAEEMIEIDRRGGGMKNMDQMLEKDGLFDIEIPTNPQKGLTDDELLELIKKTDEEKILTDFDPKGRKPSAEGGLMRTSYAFGTGLKLAVLLARKGKNLKEEIKKMIDNIFPSGDSKYDADVVLNNVLEDANIDRDAVDGYDISKAYGEAYDMLTAKRGLRSTKVPGGMKPGSGFLDEMQDQYTKMVATKKQNMPGRNHPNYELLQQSLRDAEDALTAIKMTRKKGGSLEEQKELFEKLRTQNIKEPSSVKLTESSTQVFKDSEGGIKGITMGGDKEFKKAMSEAMDEGMRESENMKRLGLDPSKMDDAFKYDDMKEAGQLEKNVTGSADLSPVEDLMKKYPGMDKNLAETIVNAPPTMKADIIAMVEQTMELSKQGKSGDEIIDIFKKKTDRTEQATGGRVRAASGGLARILNI